MVRELLGHSMSDVSPDSSSVGGGNGFYANVVTSLGYLARVNTGEPSLVGKAAVFQLFPEVDTRMEDLDRQYRFDD